MPRPRSHPGSIDRHGNRWRIRLSIRGQYVTLYAATKGDAEALARQRYDELVARADRGESVVPALPFSELLAEYRQRGMRTLSEGGRSTYELSLLVFERFFVQQRRDPRVDRIGKPVVESFLHWRSRTRMQGHGEPSPHTVAKDYRVLRRLFAWAVEQEYLDVNVVGRVKPPRAEQREYTLLRSDADLDKLLEACGPRDILRTFIVTAIETGARSESEVLWLQWRDLDFQQRTIAFAHGRDGRRLKDGESKVLPMSARLDAALRRHAENYRLALGSPYVFSSPVKRGRRQVGQRIASLRRGFKAAAKRAGFEGMRVHDLRHSTATLMLSRGHSIELVRRFLGHASLEMTMRYSHLVAEDLRELVQDRRPATGS